MQKIIQLHNTFVGKGEKTTEGILQYVLDLKTRTAAEFPTPGIYPQISFPSMIKQNILDEIHLNEIHQKSSIDFVIVTNHNQVLAIYVNNEDHTGDVKSTRDNTRYDLLEESQVIVVVIPKYTCNEIFKENLNYRSIWEVCNCLMLAGVKP